MKNYRWYFPIIISATYIAILGACSKNNDAGRFHSNLTIGAEIDAGPGKVKIAGVSETTKTPINGSLPKKIGNKFMGIETVVTAIPDGAQLCSGGFVLVTRTGEHFLTPGAYGKIKLFGSTSNFEAVDGSVVYVNTAGDSLNVFFEVPESTELKDSQLCYETTRVPASVEQKQNKEAL
jgi:hypothetical protein